MPRQCTAAACDEGLVLPPWQVQVSVLLHNMHRRRAHSWQRTRVHQCRTLLLWGRIRPWLHAAGSVLLVLLLLLLVLLLLSWVHDWSTRCNNWWVSRWNAVSTCSL